MTTRRLNDAPVLDQVEPYWQKLAALILWKLKGVERVEITYEDMKRMEAEFAGAGGAIIFVHGMYDRFAFKIVTPEEAERIAKHETTQRGNA